MKLFISVLIEEAFAQFFFTLQVCFTLHRVTAQTIIRNFYIHLLIEFLNTKFRFFFVSMKCQIKTLLI